MFVHVKQDRLQAYTEVTAGDIDKEAIIAPLYLVEAYYTRQDAYNVYLFVNFEELPKTGVLGVAITKVRGAKVNICGATIKQALGKLFNDVKIIGTARQGKACVFSFGKTSDSTLLNATWKINNLLASL